VAVVADDLLEAEGGVGEDDDLVLVELCQILAETVRETCG
jgi:hypothetical protein